MNGSAEVVEHVRAARERLLTLTEQTPALIQCCPPLTDAIARLTHALVLLDGEAEWPPEREDTWSVRPRRARRPILPART